MDGNWIKVNRQILESNVFEDAKTFKVFMWILLNANYKKRTLLNGLTLNAGQLCTSRERIATACNMHPSSVSRVLTRLKRCNSIAQKANSRGSVIEVINWGVFQHVDSTPEQLTNSKRTASEQLANTEEESKKERTLNICPQSDGLQTVNGSKGRAAYSEEFEQFWQTFPSRRKTKKRKAFADFKKAIKRVDFATLMTAVEEYARSNKGRGEFCQMPSTWLNGDCWEDDRASWDEGTPIPAARKPRTQEQTRLQAAETRLVAMRSEFSMMPEGDDREAAVAEWQRCKEILATMQEGTPCKAS